MIHPVIRKLKFRRLCVRCPLNIINLVFETLVCKSCSSTVALRWSNKRCKPLSVGQNKAISSAYAWMFRLLILSLHAKESFDVHVKNESTSKLKRNANKLPPCLTPFFYIPFRRKLCTTTHRDFAATKNTTENFHRRQRQFCIC